MNLLIFHGGFEWILAGIVVFLGLIVFGIKILRGNITGVLIGAAVWYFVYTIHHGSTAGIMTATFAALLFDLFGLPILKLFSKR